MPGQAFIPERYGNNHYIQLHLIEILHKQYLNKQREIQKGACVRRTQAPYSSIGYISFLLFYQLDCSITFRYESMTDVQTLVRCT